MAFFSCSFQQAYYEGEWDGTEYTVMTISKDPFDVAVSSKSSFNFIEDSKFQITTEQDVIELIKEKQVDKVDAVLFISADPTINYNIQLMSLFKEINADVEIRTSRIETADSEDVVGAMDNAELRTTEWIQRKTEQIRQEIRVNLSLSAIVSNKLQKNFHEVENKQLTVTTIAPLIQCLELLLSEEKRKKEEDEGFIGRKFLNIVS